MLDSLAEKERQVQELKEIERKENENYIQYINRKEA